MNTEKKKECCIFAIIAGKTVFVGKTTSDDYKAILRRHRRGEIKQTRKHFGRRGSCEPKYVPLMNITADSSLAYRYVVAFMRAFMDEGYEVLNSSGMIEHAKDLHYHTQKIWESIMLIPLVTRLQMGTQKFEAEKNPVPEETHDQVTTIPKELATKTLTIRQTPTNMQRIKDLAKRTGVSQSQVLVLLLNNYEGRDSAGTDGDCIDYVGRMLSKYKDRIEKLEDENNMLRQRLKAIKEEHKEADARREKEINRNLAAYYGYFTSLHPDNAPLAQGLYREYLSSTPASEQCRYPETEDAFIFFPERVMLGRNKRFPLFITGYDRHRRKTLLRFYPKEYFVGFSFTDEEYGVHGSCWLVRCERTKDGAMDLVFALPLDIVHKNYQNIRRTFENPLEEFMTKLDEEVCRDSIVEQADVIFGATMENDKMCADMDDEPEERSIDDLLAWAKRKQKGGR